MKGYVSVEAILFATAAKRNVSRDEWDLDLTMPFTGLRELGGKVDLKSSKR
jgi:hypothetical protein